MTVITYCSIAFFLSEMVLMITKRSNNGGTKTKDDRMSLLIFWIAIPVSMFLGFRNANYQEWNAFNIGIEWLGLALFIAGFFIRWISIFQLKKEFTVDVAISDSHQLKTTGMYKTIRHPSYSGLLLICFGLSVAMNSIISLLVITLPILFALLYRIKVEEAVLNREFGSQYTEYAQNTFRLLPGVF